MRFLKKGGEEGECGAGAGRGLRCGCAAILVPPPGIKPVPCAVEARSLNYWIAREVPKAG